MSFDNNFLPDSFNQLLSLKDIINNYVIDIIGCEYKLNYALSEICSDEDMRKIEEIQRDFKIMIYNSQKIKQFVDSMLKDLDMNNFYKNYKVFDKKSKNLIKMIHENVDKWSRYDKIIIKNLNKNN